ncbi:MAG: CAP domain-containing protein [Phycisphaerales bacterium]|nr:CAP domain-containing protein [Phycisphaerales bacterium]
MPQAHRRFSRLPLFLLGIVVSIAAGCQQQATLPQVFGDAVNGPSDLIVADPCADHLDQDRLVHEMLTAVNAERTRRNLRPLKLNPKLTQIADFYACRLVDGRFFDHVDPYDGSTVDTRAADFGYAFLKIGENLARQQRSATEVMSDLMASPRHRANLLDPAYSEIGIAVKDGGASGPYWVQEFGQPIAEQTAPATTGLGLPVVEPESNSTPHAASQPSSSRAN